MSVSVRHFNNNGQVISIFRLQCTPTGLQLRVSRIFLTFVNKNLFEDKIILKEVPEKSKLAAENASQERLPTALRNDVKNAYWRKCVNHIWGPYQQIGFRIQEKPLFLSAPSLLILPLWY